MKPVNKMGRQEFLDTLRGCLSKGRLGSACQMLKTVKTGECSPKQCVGCILYAHKKRLKTSYICFDGLISSIGEARNDKGRVEAIVRGVEALCAFEGIFKPVQLTFWPEKEAGR